MPDIMPIEPLRQPSHAHMLARELKILNGEYIQQIAEAFVRGRDIYKIEAERDQAVLERIERYFHHMQAVIDMQQKHIEDLVNVIPTAFTEKATQDL